MKVITALVVIIVVVIALSSYSANKAALNGSRKEDRSHDSASRAERQSVVQQGISNLRTAETSDGATSSAERQPTKDIEAVVSLGEQAESHSRNLGQVRLELSDLVQQAIEIQKGLLHLRFKTSAENNTRDGVPGS